MLLTEYSTDILNVACLKLTSMSFLLTLFPQSPSLTWDASGQRFKEVPPLGQMETLGQALCSLPVKIKALAPQRITSTISLDYVTIGQEGTFYPRKRVLFLLFVFSWILSSKCLTCWQSELRPGGEADRWLTRAQGLCVPCEIWCSKGWQYRWGAHLRLLGQQLHLPTPLTPPHLIITNHFS